MSEIVKFNMVEGLPDGGAREYVMEVPAEPRYETLRMMRTLLDKIMSANEPPMSESEGRE